ncbi:MAG: response regulator, partial [Bacteroidia bacterium]
ALIGDHYRLNQIINNLLTNAFKFTTKGKVTLENKLVGIENNISIIQFTISDTGIGIPKQNIEKIFDTFTQASNTTNNKYGGTGLGLSISKQLIERMGGAITVNSKLNTGSTFVVTLTMPVAKSSRTRKLAVVKGANDFIKPVRILAVDDNEINRFYVENIFTDKNISVKSAENGRACLNLLKKESFDLILMDLQMPVMDGYKTTLKIRNSLKLTTPIIALTASSVVQEESKCLAAGMNGLIQKPFTKDSILQAITDHTDLNKSQQKIKKTIFKKPVIDFSKIRSITGNNEERFFELLELSLKNIDRDVKKLDSAIENKNFSDIRSLAHKLKSTFGLYELNDIFKTLDGIEELGEKKTSLKKIEKEFTQLKQPISNVVSELMHYKNKI